MALPGNVGYATLAAGQDTVIGTLSDVAIVNINFSNNNSGIAKIRLAFGPPGTTAIAQAKYINYDTPVDGNEPLERTGWVLESGTKIWARCDIGNVDVWAHGIAAA